MDVSSYSQPLPHKTSRSFVPYIGEEPILIFFEQTDLNKNRVVYINDGRKLCNILEHAYGLEYFIINEKISYLLAVNWYAIEGVGTITCLINELRKSSLSNNRGIRSLMTPKQP